MGAALGTMNIYVRSILLIHYFTGSTFRHLMKFSHGRGYIDRESYITQYLASAIFITGIVSTLGSDDLLAAFAAGPFLYNLTCIELLRIWLGSAISWDGEFNLHTEGESFAPIIDFILNCGCFVYIGAWLPFTSFSIPELGISPWNLVLLSCGVVLLRRIPAILALYKWIPEITTWQGALFCGHFGTYISFAMSSIIADVVL